MRTRRTAESLDDERTPADNQPPVAPSYHPASIDLPRQAFCSPCDQVGRVWLAHPVGTGGWCVRRSTQGVQADGEHSLKSSIDERRPCPIVLAGGSGGGSGDDQLIDRRRRPPHLARPAQQVAVIAHHRGQPGVLHLLRWRPFARRSRLLVAGLPAGRPVLGVKIGRGRPRRRNSLVL